MSDQPVSEPARPGAARPLGLTLLSGAIAALMVFPLTWLLYRASGVEFERAYGIVVRPRTLEILTNSVLLMVGVTLLSVFIAVPLAVLTVRTDLPYRRFWTVVVALPLAVPSYIGAFAFVSVFRPRGIVQGWLEPLGVQELPSIYGLPGAIVIIALYTYPYVYVTTRAALIRLDTTLVDAARTLEHDRLAAFRRVTLPQIRPAIVAGALLVALYAVSDFGTPAFLQAEVYTRQIYLEHRSLGGADYAAFLSLQLIVITVFILAVESRVRGSETIHTSGAAGRTDDRIRLGRLKYPATLACGLLGFVTLAMPILIYLSWLSTSQSDVPESFTFQWVYVWNSVQVAGLAAVVAALFALPVAYLSARSDSRLGHLFERATYVGYAVPGIIIGLALVFFGANYGDLALGPLSLRVYQSIPILVFAYVVRFMPQAVGSTRTSILQVNPRLHEAARTLGHGPLEAFRQATLPLIAPGIVAGAALVFLTTMKELPATLLLRPTGFETLVTRIWAAESASLYGHAAIPALILILVSGISMVIILRQERV
ncbi:ABC transporter permease [Natronosalvus halobius]|uniref:ABC transporter permease n=1 Tax=Natronosalvus halobius TaxID=2953746 RepID=UPI00209F2523|nr:iron ABC transporter permease [Natronosalvus halobius]USZ70686.1 iron ABC transporter permease [Natronosalvus halobius]